jgi:hypothetical protein
VVSCHVMQHNYHEIHAVHCRHSRYLVTRKVSSRYNAKALLHQANRKKQRSKTAGKARRFSFLGSNSLPITD